MKVTSLFLTLIMCMSIVSNHNSIAYAKANDVLEDATVYETDAVSDGDQAEVASTTNTDPYEGKIWTNSGPYWFDESASPAFGYYADYMGYRNLAFTPFGSDAADLNHELGDYATLHFSTTPYGSLLDLFDDIAQQHYSPLLLSDATWNYNGHSYAWISQNSETNDIWLISPYVYINDMSYVEVTTPRPGDILVYIDNDKPGYKRYIHSAIVESVENTNADSIEELLSSIMVTSKWDFGPLYYHGADDCPYEWQADEFKFYRLNTDDSVTLSTTNDYSIKSKNVSGDGVVANNIAFYELNVTENANYDIIVSSNQQLTIALLDENLDNVAIARFSDSNNQYIYLKNLAPGKYYLKIQTFYLSTSGVITTKVGYHSEHTYVYKGVSNSHHILKCACGTTSGSNQAHLVRSVSENGVTINYCITCGYLVKDLGGNIPVIKKLDGEIRPNSVGSEND